MRRVAITGLGAVCGLGPDVPALLKGIREGTSAVRYMKEWEELDGLRCLAGAPAELGDIKAIPRKTRRAMGRMSFFGAQAAEEAVEDAHLTRDEVTSGRLGCVVGSTTGSAETLFEMYGTLRAENTIGNLAATKIFQCFSHTAVMNLSQHLGITGSVIATSAACASGLQAIGTGFDLIRMGRQDVVLCGGTDGLHSTVTGSFDLLFATSTNYNDSPTSTPRPFDRDRDGLVCGEGSGILVLECYEHALRRNARIYAEIVGYHTCGSGAHLTQSKKDAMAYCMTSALEDAGLQANDVDYVNAHATATLQGDAEEAKAVEFVFGNSVPVSSLKGYIGHTLGASGSIELIASLAMMEHNLIYPTRNLENVATDCEGIDHVMTPRAADIEVLVKNCFAFGGINASLVCRKPQNASSERR